MSNELENFINENREAFDSKMPDPAMLNRIRERMDEGTKKKGIVISFRAVRWAAACLVIVAGAAIFLTLQKSNVVTTAAVTKEAVKQPAVTPSPEQQTAQNDPQPVSAGNTQKEQKEKQAIADNRTVFFASLNDMNSPSRRVLAASQLNNLGNVDRDIVDALVTSMNGDPNTNVRLAALEALSRFHREKYVKTQLVNSLKKQTDPMVQIQLIQLLTRMRQTSIIDQLQKIADDAGTMDAVKENAYSGILSLKS